MIRVLYQFPKSIDPEAFDQFLNTNLFPGLKQARGLHAIHESLGDMMSAGGPPPYTKVVEVSFETLDDLMNYVQSPLGLATQDFIEGNEILILFYEAKDNFLTTPVP